MLVVSLRLGESVMVGDSIKVTYTSRNGVKIRLGFDAPREFPVWRERVYNDRKERQRAEAEKAVREGGDETKSEGVSL